MEENVSGCFFSEHSVYTFPLTPVGILRSHNTPDNSFHFSMLQQFCLHGSTELKGHCFVCLVSGYVC